MSYLYADHLTSTSGTNGGQASSQLYYPYGAKRSAGSVATPYRYTGQRWEEALGLYFYNARWYDPALGRFLQPDTLVPEPGNPQALNRYSYTLNNPVKYSDPSGHWIQLEDAFFSQDYGFQFGAFGVRYASDGQLRILHGGQRFRNYAEIAIGNYVLSGGSTHLPDLGGTVPALAAKTANYALLEVSGEGAGSTSFAQQILGDPLLMAACGMAVMKGIEGEFKTTFHGHHTVPKEILNKYLPQDIASAVRGKKGAPNIWHIPEKLHKAIHAGPGGGLYNARFIEEIGMLDPANMTAQDILDIRNKLAAEFKFDEYRPK